MRQGAGKELEEKFLAAHSSSALAVNGFARFKGEGAALRLPMGDGFKVLGFEKKCPQGLNGTPPHLDVLADGRAGVVGIESKCLEFLKTKKASFEPAYDAEIRDGRRTSAWFGEMQRLTANPKRYRWLDAAQLVRHAFGLAHTFHDRPATLLYLFWEPSNPDAYPVFREHRDEVARFGESIRGGTPDFVPMSYPELWRLWEDRDEPEWLEAHLRHLRDRYGVAV